MSIAGMPRERPDGLCYHMVPMPAGDNEAQQHTQVALVYFNVTMALLDQQNSGV